MRANGTAVSLPMDTNWKTETLSLQRMKWKLSVSFMTATFHTNEGVAGVAKYLNRNGFVKKLRQNNHYSRIFKGASCRMYWTIPFTWVRSPMADAGRKRSKVQETRCVVEQSEFPISEGQHEAIISGRRLVSGTGKAQDQFL